MPKKNVVKYLILLILLPCVILFSACTKTPATPVYVTGVVENSNGGFTITYSNGTTKNINNALLNITDLKEIWKEEHENNESFSEFLIKNAHLTIGYNVGVAELKTAWQEDFDSGVTTLTFSEFLAEFANVGEGYDLTKSINKTLFNCVSIVASFTYTTTYNPWTGTGGKEETTHGAGSGVFYKLDTVNKEAYIITNYHVVYDSENSKKVSNDIKVCVYGSEDYSEDSTLSVDAKFIGGSSTYDIAVLKITESCKNSSVIFENDKLAPAVLEDSNNVYVGEQIYAIGNAQGSGISAVQGIISVDSENIIMDTTTQETSREIRITAPVNPGNSGGGLFNAKGKLIGIVNAKIVDESVEGIGYAIPLNVAKAVADNIIANCDGVNNTKAKVVRVGLTIGVKTSSAVIDENTECAKIEEQIYILAISENSLASTVNLQEGDIINSIKVKQTSTSAEKELKVTRMHILTDSVLSCFVGGSVELNITHKNGTTENVKLTFTNSNLSEIA